jgi:cold shock CspA family protein
MGRSQETFSKKEKEKKRRKKKEDKEKRKIERKENSDGGGLDNMIAYVDEFGNIVDTPPEVTKSKGIKAEDIEIGVPKREKEEEPAFRTGTVVFFNDSKGYGFIREDNTDEKYFVHANGLLVTVAENDKVKFNIERGQKGMNAVEVDKL